MSSLKLLTIPSQTRRSGLIHWINPINFSKISQYVKGHSHWVVRDGSLLSFALYMLRIPFMLENFFFFSCKCACGLMKQLIIRFYEEKKLTNICLCVRFTHPRRLVSLLPVWRTYRDLNLHHRSLSIVKTRKIIIILIHNERQLRAIPSCICSTDHHHLHRIH